jgi:hypothetical protein
MGNEQDDDRMVPTAEVQRRYGQVSHMWVERRLKDDPTFPRPFYISRRRCWRVADLTTWERGLARRGAAA